MVCRARAPARSIKMARGISLRVERPPGGAYNIEARLKHLAGVARRTAQAQWR
jgi:hypothetical protein